jgi:hypothetical protein
MHENLPISCVSVVFGCYIYTLYPFFLIYGRPLMIFFLSIHDFSNLSLLSFGLQTLIFFSKIQFMPSLFIYFYLLFHLFFNNHHHFWLFHFLWYWGLKSRPTLWATPPALFCDVFFWDRVLWTIFLSCLQTAILLISASWVGRIMEWAPGACFFLFFF